MLYYFTIKIIPTIVVILTIILAFLINTYENQLICKHCHCYKRHLSKTCHWCGKRDL